METTTLDRLFDEHGVGEAALVKLDVEGAEPEALEGIDPADQLLIANFVVVRSVSLNPFTERLLEGSPTVLVKDGTYVDQGLRREGLARDEVDMAIREHGIADVTGVQVAYLEPDGTVSVIPSDQTVLRGRRKVRRVRQFRKH